MWKSTIDNFQALRRPVKVMLYLHWIYSFSSSLTGMFVQIYLYQRFSSITFNIIGQMGYFLGCAIGFSVLGALFSRYHVNIKWVYVYAFIAFAVSFLFLIGAVTRADGLIFLFMNGLGLGLYWLTLHTFELTETFNVERDYYSSVLTAVEQFIELTAPAVATILFYVSEDVLHLPSFTLLFIIAPLVYLFGIPLFRHVANYYPSVVELSDFTHFVVDKKNRRAQLYLFANSVQFALGVVIVPITAIMFLGSEKHVGIFNTVFAVFAAVALMVLSKFRHSGSRLKFLFWTSVALFGVSLLPAFRFDFPTFIAFSLLSVIFMPLSRVSQHVIDLETMETFGRPGRDFYPTMILRDLAFGFWRVVILAAFALTVSLVGEGESVIRLAFFAVAVSYLLSWWGGVLMYKKR